MQVWFNVVAMKDRRFARPCNFSSPFVVCFKIGFNQGDLSLNFFPSNRSSKGLRIGNRLWYQTQRIQWRRKHFEINILLLSFLLLGDSSTFMCIVSLLYTIFVCMELSHTLERCLTTFRNNALFPSFSLLWDSKNW